MAATEQTIQELVTQIERGEMRLPEMQRRYVWRATRVRDLLDSLYRGYPSGTILLWETDQDADVPEREFAIGQKTNPRRRSLLLLDGQQRLTSLSAILRGEPVKVRGRKNPIDILFNLDHPDNPIAIGVAEDADTDTAEYEVDVDDEDAATLPLGLAGDEDSGQGAEEQEADATEDEILRQQQEMTFVVANKKLERLPNWVSVTKVFKSASDTQILKAAGIKGFDDPKHDHYVNRLRALRDIPKYKYRLDILDSALSYEQVTEIFVRVNSLGAKLRGSDLAMAQITAKWRGSLVEFEGFQEKCSKRGIDTDIGTYVRTLVCMATGQSQFHTVRSLDEGALKSGWQQAQKGLEYAINYLKSNMGVDSMALLSSPYLIIALAAYGVKHEYALSSEQEKDLRKWLLVANAKGRYSRGSSESLLNQDLAAIFRGSGLKGMLDNLTQQFGRLEIAPDDLVGLTQRSGIFKTMFLVFKQDGAKDWRTRLVIAYDHAGASHKLQFHHIFPKAFLGKRYDPKQVNELANLAFVSGKANRAIGKKNPAAYFKEIADEHGTQLFDLQCVPHNPELLELDAYPKFLEERRRLISARLNDYIFA